MWLHYRSSCLSLSFTLDFILWFFLLTFQGFCFFQIIWYLKAWSIAVLHLFFFFFINTICLLNLILFQSSSATIETLSWLFHCRPSFIVYFLVFFFFLHHCAILCVWCDYCVILAGFNVHCPLQINQLNK